MAKRMSNQQKAVLGILVFMAILFGLYSAGVLQSIRFTEAEIAAGKSFSLTYACNVGGCSEAVSAVCGSSVNSWQGCVTAIRCAVTDGPTATSSGFEGSFMTVPATYMTATAPTSSGSKTINCVVDAKGTAVFHESRTVTVQAQASCSNTCSDVGQWQCNGDRTYVQCGDFNGDGCKEWGTTTQTCAQYAQSPMYYGCRSGQCVVITPPTTTPTTPTCTVERRCDGNMAFIQTSQCARAQETTCPYGCNAGECLTAPPEQPPTQVIVGSGGAAANDTPAIVNPPSCAASGYCTNAQGLCVICPSEVPNGTQVGGPSTQDFCSWAQGTLGTTCTTLAILAVVILVFALVLVVIIVRRR